MVRKICEVCSTNESNYKCPTCLLPFCSVACSRAHKQTLCEPAHPHENSGPKESVVEEDEDEDRVILSENVLRSIGSNEDIKRLVSQKRFRDALLRVDGAHDRRKALELLMTDPEFVVLADLLLEQINFSDP
uniref:HIT-type domain-containing protein n=1 Tax=Rhodosorus marinus TaxID=101924 RepID=A0A7S0BLQ5_9RHOD|mmetsp:Transcript_21365/g.31057  ORF Transcript_21365/g.31057 Transcript_21365/m.31057 type:complete len:132 (+) Transcript_21365:226-621(+)